MVHQKIKHQSHNTLPLKKMSSGSVYIIAILDSVIAAICMVLTAWRIYHDHQKGHSWKQLFWLLALFSLFLLFGILMACL